VQRTKLSNWCDEIFADVTAVGPSLKLRPMTDTADESTATKSKPRSGGTKETIESILVAFILAFVFRAFVFEAFVIPTGSMATTLLGAHTRFECPDCGYKFDVNYQSPSSLNESDEGDVPDRAAPITTPIYCPNCGFQMPDTQTGRPEVVDQYGNVKKQGILGPIVFYGDRILVLKYLYLISEPRRWDVVVFKPPTQLSQNFIKRLIGKPGEAVLVLDGDIWIRAPHDPDPRHFVIQTKPDDVQPAMWRLVYNNDYHPKGEYRASVAPWQQPWKASSGTGWDTADKATGGRALLFNNTSAGSTLRFDELANITAQSTSDYLVHDQASDGMPARNKLDDKDASRHANEIPVSDLDLRLTYERTAGAGPLELKLTKRDHRFRAVILPGSAALFDDVAGKSTQVGPAVSIPAGSDPVRLELSNADYHVELKINDKVVIQTTPASYHPDLATLLDEYNNDVTPPRGIAEISASSQQCRLTHVSLWRDLYYYNREDLPVLRDLRWATPRNFPNGAQQLGPDEYFTMGDNSLVSFDARIWPTGLDLPEENLNVAAGRVPGRFLLGKAFYVYWPAGHSINPSLPALVPNFGSMRFIH
jgi:signal peptidase I